MACSVLHAGQKLLSENHSAKHCEQYPVCPHGKIIASHGFCIQIAHCPSSSPCECGHANDSIGNLQSGQSEFFNNS